MTLTDDDTAPTAITLTTSPTSVSESASGTTVTVTATLDGGATLLTATEVTVSVGGGTATSGTDYDAVSDFAVTIPKETASGTGTFTLTPTNDSLAEGDETIDVTGTAADFTVTKAQVTLTDDETAPGSITLTVSPTSVEEDDGATTVTVTATLGGSATLLDATEVTVSVGGGTATSGTDYAAVSDFAVTIPKETASGTGTFTLTPTNDSLAEGEETIDVTGSATGFTVTKAEVTLTDDAPPVEVGFAQTSYTVAEGGTVTVTVELSAVPEREVEVALTHTAQGVTTAADYSGVPTSVTFAPSETEQTFTFAATADDVDDDGDSVLLGFGTLPDEVSAPDTTARPASATVSITDDDVPPVQVFFEPAAYTVAEDSAIAVTVRLDVAPERLVSVPITVANQGDTTAADYSGAPTIVVFAGDETEQSFSFAARDDTVDDDGESVVLGFGELPARVSAPDTTARPASATVSITDDDTALASITLTTLPVSVSESASGTTVTVTATLDGSVTLPGATEVTVSVGGGTATSGTDYAAVSGFTVTIPKETASGTGTFTLTPTNDAIAEGDETIDVTGMATDFTVTKAQVTLTDDDTAPTAITLTTSPTSVSESASGTTVTVTATLDGGATLLTATTVTVSVGGGTATSGTDYDAVSDFAVTIPKETASGTGTFTLTPTNDSLAEGEETIDVTGTAADFTVTKAQVTLTDDETAPGSITLTVSPTSVEEDDGATTVTVTATLGGSATLLDATEVTVSVGGGTATSGTDYAAVSDFAVTIPKETASGTGTFTLTPTNDSLAEGEETIDVTGSATGFTVTKAEVTLTDDAPPVEVGFAQTSYTVAEGGTVTVTVELSAVPEREVEVALTHTAQGVTTAADYSGVPTSVTFAPSETEQTFTFAATADDVDDDGDSVLLGFGTLPDEVSAPDTTARPASATVSITDDDVPPVQVFFEPAAYTVAEDSAIAVTVRLDVAPERLVSVPITVANQGDTTAADYSGAPTIVVFAGDETEQSFSFAARDDTVDDDGESVVLGFGELPARVSAPDTTARPASATVSITDDDTALASITLTTLPVSVSESASGTTVTVTATLDGSVTLPGATEVTVSVGGGTATSGTDYAAVSDFTVTIPKESARGTGIFTLTPTNDAIAEGDESIDVTGTADGFTVTKAEVTLTDDDTASGSITLTVSPTSVGEDDGATTVTVTATLGGSATLPGATEVSVSVGGGSATSGTDYTAVSDFTVTIPKETASGSGTFILTPTQDDIAEGNESIDVTGMATDFTVTKAEMTLADDETAPAAITLTASPTSVGEDDGATTVTVTATLGGSATLLTATEVSVSVGGGTATSGTDYAAVSDFTVTIPKESASGTGTFTLTPTQDDIAEGDESIDVTGTADGFTVTKAEMTLTDDDTASGSITLTVSPTSVGEDDGATTVTVTATLGGSATLLTATEVSVSVGGGTATSGTDYAAVSDFTVTIPKESASGTGTFTLTPTQDDIAEGDESIDVTGTADGFTVTKAEMTLTDDETAPAAITLTTSPTSVSESATGTTVTVTATLGGSATLLTATEVSVSVGGGSATSGTDYTAVSDFTVTIPKETASGSGTFTLTPTQDDIAEGDESIDVTGNATGFTVTKAEVTLTDDETVPAALTLTTSPGSVLESASGTTVTVTATLDDSMTLPGATEVSVSVGGGSATSGTDYTAVSDFTVTIPKETASGTGTFTLTPTQDDIAEGDESIDVTGNATGFTVTKAEMTLTDDETAPASITLTASPTSVGEDDGATTVTVTATLDGSVTLLTATEVTVSVGGGSATSGTDYTAVSDFTVTIPKETASGSETFTLTPTQDTIAEGDESIDVTGTADGFTVTKAEVTLTDDDTASGSITLTVSPTSVGEDDGATTVTVTATLGGSATLLTATEVSVSVGGGTATSGTDYAAVSDFTVTIPKETASASGTFTLTPTQDDIAEGDESIDVTGTADGFTVTKAEVTLTDDETAPASITLTASPTSVGEDDGAATVTVTATLDGSVTLLTATEVTVSVGGGSATSGTDYTAVSDFTVTIPKETASGTGTFTLTPTNDAIAEGDESVDVTGMATDFTVTKAQVTLTDDDTASGSITLTVSPTSVGEDDGATTVTVTATLGGSATLLTATEVTVSVGGGSATSGTDYTAVSNFTVTIPKETASASGTFTLTPTQDTIAEGDETIDVTGSATDFTVTKAEMTLTDDETAPATITLTTSPTSLGEDDDATTVTVTATLDGSATRPGATEVTVSVGGGTATSGTDYTAVSNFTVTIPKETASETGTFTLTPTQDDIAEGDETIDVTGTADDFTVTKAEMTLTDDETAPASITLTTSPTSVGEDDGVTTVTVTATLGGSATRPSATAVTVSVGGGSATSGTDYTAVSDFTVTIPRETASGSGTFTLTPTQDTIAEGDETIDVTGSATDFTVTKAQVTLTDDVPRRTVSFDKPVFSVTEGTTRQVLMQVDLSGPLDREVTIPLTRTHGSGVEANDYVLAAIGVEDYYAGNDTWTSLDGDLVFPPAETAKIVRVTAVDDGIVEDDEILELGFGTLPEGISPGSIRVATVTITDNDSDDGDGDNDGDVPPTPRATLHLSDADGEVAEDAGAVPVTATVSPASASAFTVTVSASPVAPATDADFELSTNRVLRFAANANASIGTVTIAPVDDGDAEPTRVVTVAGSASVAGVTGPDDVTLTILDDDAPRIRGICDRTPRVRDRILVRLKYQHGFKDTCAEVTEADLAKLTLLDLRRNPSNEPAVTLSLQRHDFEGLSNLVELDLADTGLASLPAGVFDGLANLETLNLNKNRLGSLPPWVFADLRSLETLRLQKNPSLRSLPYDELEELPALTLLRVDREGRRKLQVAGGEGDTALEVAAGASATYRVRLMAAPDFRITAANPVRIGVNSDTVGVTASPATLPLTRENWFRRQTVTVRADASAFGATATLDHEPSGTTTDSQGQEHSNYDFESYPLPRVTVRVTGDAGAAAHGRAAAVAAADARAREGEDGTIDFAVTLSRAVPATVEVSYATADGTATAGEDYTRTGGRLGFAPGETMKTVRVPVLDDVVDEGEETFTLRLANASGAVIADRVATGTIINSDPLQGMLLSGFGRTVVGQVLDAVTGRLSESPAVSRVTLGGRSIGHSTPSADTGTVRHPLAATPGAAGATGEGGPPAGPAPDGSWGDPAARGGGTGTTGRGLPLGGSFHVATGDGEAGGPSVVVWGRTTVSDFHAEARADNGAVRLDGEVAAGILGADTEMGRWLAGVAVAASRGEGTFVQPGGDSGTVDSRLISVNPYVRYAASDRLMAWGMLGFGIGDITIRGNSVVHTDVSLRLGAAGARGVLLAGGETGGIDLALRGDAFLVRMRAAAAANSMETRVEAIRLRLGLEAGRSFALGDGVLAPALELGLRHDGGDAQTATGIELGGRIRYVHRGSGLTVEANARTMIAHHDSSYREWGAGGSVRLDATGRGLSFSLAPVWGTPSSAVDRLWSAHDAADLVRGGTFEAERRLLGEFGYGFGAFRGRGLVTPFVGLGLGRAEDRTWRAGARWSLAPHLAMSLDLLTRREPSNDDDAQHGGRFRLALHW